MKLNKVESNSLFEAIVAVGLDPAEFTLRTRADVRWPGVIHRSSGSYFKVRPASFRRGFNTRSLGGKGRVSYGHYDEWEDVLSETRSWCAHVKAPDLWTDLKQAKNIFTAPRHEEPENTPFTQDEQNEIAAQLEAVKKELPEKFELSSEQMERIEERLDEAAEASKRMGRRDWLLLFGGSVLSLILTDIVTPGVAEHIFTMTIYGLAHLFTGGGGPPQIPPRIIA